MNKKGKLTPTELVNEFKSKVKNCSCGGKAVLSYDKNDGQFYICCRKCNNCNFGTDLHSILSDWNFRSDKQNDFDCKQKFDLKKCTLKHLYNKKKAEMGLRKEYEPCAYCPKIIKYLSEKGADEMRKKITAINTEKNDAKVENTVAETKKQETNLPPIVEKEVKNEQKDCWADVMIKAAKEPDNVIDKIKHFSEAIASEYNASLVKAEIAYNNYIVAKAELSTTINLINKLTQFINGKKEVEENEN